jgi:class 3 adenylate cyclase/tetratricopeptide (TPR) repeat protein
VIECPRCATPNPPGSRFCNSCGATLVSRVGVQERRVITALFADLARSTSLAERLDPEVVRDMVGRFFELATTEIGRRGGSVEKFSGDAVMAVFGLPTAHEDDPERAVRAALAIRDNVAALAADTQARHGVALQARIGIESGEVVVGDPFGGATMATGDAMNLAARLEQQAEPGQIVVGATAYEQVRDLVAAEPLGDLEIRGRDETIRGWRVTSVSSEVGRPRGVPGLEAPLTGRDEELALLLDAARRASHEGKPVLFTILGVPGVGKSRLAREATTRLAQEGWSTVRGRCLPYGDGITYWPVAEIVRSLAGIGAEATADEALDRLATISPDADVAGHLANALGVDQGGGDSTAAAGGDREIAWAFRRLLEHVAAERGPQALIFEDIHWAEPPLLDLIEYLAIWAREAPLLIICPSRPELLDTRPAWGAGRMEASRIQLEPLTEAESRSLLAALLAVEDLPAALRQRVLDRAEGNPLFVEEVVRMLIDEGVVERRDGRWFANRAAADVRVPDSVEALIRARLDTLPSAERAVLQAASVVGRVFQRSAVAALAPSGEGGGGSAAIEGHLEDAVLRDLITEERVPGERTFRFRHILIRDVAYGTLPKARRAELHRGVARWLREWAAARMEEFVEIEAYHLEQAALLGRELSGQADAADVGPAVAALEASARKALARDDMRAVRSFAERALALDPPTDARLDLEWLVLDSLERLGEWETLAERAGALEQAAIAAGRRDIEGRAIYARAAAIWIAPGRSDVRAAVSEMRRARELLSEAGDDRYLLRVLEYLGYEGWWYGNLEAPEKLWLEEAALARANGWLSQEAEVYIRLYGIYWQRSRPDEARRMLDVAGELARRGPSRLTRAHVDRALGSFLGRTGSTEEAVELLRATAPVLEELGDQPEFHAALMSLGDIAYRDERPAEALSLWEESVAPVIAHGGYLPEAKRRMAQALIDLGRVDEAVARAEEAVEVTGAEDLATVATTRMALGLAREAQGRLDEAETLLRDALEVNARTEFSPLEEELALAEFLLRRGRTAEGDEWLERARASARRYGPESPYIGWVEHRAANARQAAAER